MKLSMAVMVVAALLVCSSSSLQPVEGRVIGKVIDYLEGQFCPPPPGSADAPYSETEPSISPAPEVDPASAPGSTYEPAAPVDELASPPAPPSYETPPQGGY